ncbi:hypothetical protein J4Q44_G00086590 [Coregonus suidteri]|uniref:Uncharacterized protein n=1 Tax=Coregonus suidteri TaxID=861788 RepID=A0AAN8M2J4_9TELE
MLAVETGLERKANEKRQRSRRGTTLARVQRVLPRTNAPEHRHLRDFLVEEDVKGEGQIFQHCPGPRQRPDIPRGRTQRLLDS